MLRVLAALVVPVLILLAYTADAEDVAAPIGRYTLSEVEDGFLRLDTANGRVSLCHRRDGDWMCELIPDDKAAYEDEVARLTKENRQLREDVAALKRGEKDDSGIVELPDRTDVDRVLAFFDRVMRRFIDIVKSLKEEATRERTGVFELPPSLAPLPPSGV